MIQTAIQTATRGEDILEFLHDASILAVGFLNDVKQKTIERAGIVRDAQSELDTIRIELIRNAQNPFNE